MSNRSVPILPGQQGCTPRSDDAEPVITPQLVEELGALVNVTAQLAKVQTWIDGLLTGAQQHHA